MTNLSEQALEELAQLVADCGKPIFYRPSREQKLIDLLFEHLMRARAEPKWFFNATREEIAEWVRSNLRECGFPTHPQGLSWGALDVVVERTAAQDE